MKEYSLSKEIEDIKQNQMEIFQGKLTMTKMKNSMDGLKNSGGGKGSN